MWYILCSIYFRYYIISYHKFCIIYYHSITSFTLSYCTRSFPNFISFPYPVTVHGICSDPRRSYVLCCSQTGPFSTSWFKLDTARIFCFFGYFVADLANWARKRSQKDPVWKSTSPIANGYPWILCVTCTAFPGAKTTQKLGPHHELRSVVRS
jgi:hypothetical protein